MAILENLRAVWMQARRDRDGIISNLLGTIIGQCETESHGSQGKAAHVLTETEVIGIVQSTLKRLDETITHIEGKSAYNDEYMKLVIERGALLAFLPSMMTEEELRLLISNQVLSGSNLGTIMAYLKTGHTGKYDARRATEIIKEVIVDQTK